MTNKELFDKAKKYIPGGVNSPVRSYKSVGGTPPFIKKARGAYIWDEEDNEYIDFIGSWGPMILGHADVDVAKAVAKAAQNSTSYGAPTKLEVGIAELLCENIPGIDKLRLVNSGTEATMTAIRLARGYTKRQKIVKFEGCYHGHADQFLISAGSGVLSQAKPDSAGLAQSTINDTLLASFNDIDSVRKVLEDNKGEVAAIIIEPVAANMGCVLPQANFLKSLRELCTKHGVVLIFDEVITGFRLAFGGAQAYFDIQADLVTYGKIIGGGLPVGAIGGRAEIMDHLAPLGDVYQAGTLSGNPLAVSAGLVVLKKLLNVDYYVILEEQTNWFVGELKALFQKHQLPVAINHVASLLTIFFTDKPVNSFADVQQMDKDKYTWFFHEMLKAGVYLAPSPYECWFISAAHSKSDLGKVLFKVNEILKSHPFK